ncbi:MAG TPA: hypothetical protein VG943_04460 [Caulobacterales bacterium]|nr:hypothetical protein [Caulobacterales bacterium]
MGAIFNVFPLILIPVLIYNIWAFASTAGQGSTPGAEIREHLRNGVFLRVPMASSEAVPGGVAGATQTVEWLFSFGDLLILISLVLLFIELLKSTSTGTSAIFNHALSMLVFIICLVEFLLHPAFATSTFFFILIMSLLDVLAGVVVTIVSARRDVEFAGNH